MARTTAIHGLQAARAADGGAIAGAGEVDHWQTHWLELRFRASRPAFSEGHAVDFRQDVDSTRLPADHPYLAALQQLGFTGDCASEAKFHQRTSNASRVLRRHLNEYIEILGEPRLTVPGDCVTSDQQKPYVMRE